MNSAYGNTRFARALVWLCAIGDVYAFFLMCLASASVNGPGVLGWLLVGAGLLVGNGVTALYAVREGLPFEVRMQRRFKHVCAGLGGSFVGQGRMKFKPRLALDPFSSIANGQWERQTIYPKLRKVRGSYHEGWTGEIRPFLGQTLDLYNKNAPAFMMAYHAQFCGFDIADNGLIRIRVGKVPVPDAYGHPGALPTRQGAHHPARLPQAAPVVMPVYADYQQGYQQQGTYQQANGWAQERALLQAVPMARDLQRCAKGLSHVIE